MGADLIVIDALTEADAPRCAELEQTLFAGDDPWPVGAFVDAVKVSGPHQHYFAARRDGVLVGYAGIALLGPEAEVHTIAVDPAEQGRGTGRALLAALLDAAPRATVFLEVRTDNDAAIELYRSVGFDVVGTRRGYYRPSGADAYTMRLDSSQRA